MEKSVSTSQKKKPKSSDTMKQKDERPIISFRVDKSIRDKIIEMYGGYTPLEKIIEEHFLDDDVTPPSVIKDNKEKIKDYKDLKKEYCNMYKSNKKRINQYQNHNETILTKINRIDSDIKELFETNKHILKTVEDYTMREDEKLTHSLQMVITILEENKEERKLKPTPRIPKKVIKLYSDNCNMKLKNFINLLPQELKGCIE